MTLDKFYTNPDISKKCINEIKNLNKYDLVIEPSAGNGSFLCQLKKLHQNVIGLDISPEHPDIIAQDFFEYTPPSNSGKILVVGNPPFGRVSSTAIKFFNHSAEWCDTIAFIIPKTFKRISVQNKLNMNFHLIYEYDIPMKPCSFTPKMDAKCCFQIWKKRINKRQSINLSLTHPDWEFLKLGPKKSDNLPTPPNGADFAIRAYGSNCGKIITCNLQNLAPKSFHWIKSNISIKELISRFESLDYSISLDTARQESIGKGEIVSLYCQKYDKKLS
jgi:predicted RNA methylase